MFSRFYVTFCKLRALYILPDFRILDYSILYYYILDFYQHSWFGLVDVLFERNTWQLDPLWYWYQTKHSLSHNELHEISSSCDCREQHGTIWYTWYVGYYSWYLNENVYADGYPIYIMLLFINTRFLYDRSWMSPWIKPIPKELYIKFHGLALHMFCQRSKTNYSVCYVDNFLPKKAMSTLSI